MSTTTQITLLVTIASGFGAIGLQVFMQGLLGRTGRPRAHFSDNVDEAIRALRSASRLVQQLERDIAKRSESIERLHDEQELLRLSKSEVEAVSHLLQDDARREGQRAVIINLVSSALFFLAGVGVTLLLA